MSSKLFQPIKVGNLDLTHRVVLAPLTRLRVNAQHVPNEITAEYYSQRASEPGTLLITEATFIAGQAGGYPHVPGLWNKEQTAAWKKVWLCLLCIGSNGIIYPLLNTLGYRRST